MHWSMLRSINGMLVGLIIHRCGNRQGILNLTFFMGFYPSLVIFL